MFEASLRNGKGQKSQKTPTAGTTTSDENEKRKKAKVRLVALTCYNACGKVFHRVPDKMTVNELATA